MRSALTTSTPSNPTAAPPPSAAYRLPVTADLSVELALEIGGESNRQTLLNLSLRDGPFTAVRLVTDLPATMSIADIIPVLKAVALHASDIVRAFPRMLEIPEVVAGISPLHRLPLESLRDEYWEAREGAYTALHRAICDQVAVHS